MADLPMPQLWEAVTEGATTWWSKPVSDSAEGDEPLLGASTDKTHSEVHSPVSRTLTEAMTEKGDTVGVGTALARVGDTPEAPQGNDADSSGDVPSEAGASVAPEQAAGDKALSPTGPSERTQSTDLGEQYQHFGLPGRCATVLHGASAGLKVAVIEKNRIAGTRRNVGWIPASEMIETAHVKPTIEKSVEFGLSSAGIEIDRTRTLERWQWVHRQAGGGLTSSFKNRKGGRGRPTCGVHG